MAGFSQQKVEACCAIQTYLDLVHEITKHNLHLGGHMVHGGDMGKLKVDLVVWLLKHNFRAMPGVV